MSEIPLQKNPYNERIQDWCEESLHVKNVLTDYNWQYRKKICSKCSLEKQKKLDCQKVGNYKFGVQETYCKNLLNARAKKNKKLIKNFINFHPLRT